MLSLAWSKVIGQKLLHIPCSCSRRLLLCGMLRKRVQESHNCTCTSQLASKRVGQVTPSCPNIDPVTHSGLQNLLCDYLQSLKAAHRKEGRKLWHQERERKWPGKWPKIYFSPTSTTSEVNSVVLQMSYHKMCMFLL